MNENIEDYFHVFKKGQLTVVGFTAVGATAPQNASACRERLIQLIEDNSCQDLVADLHEMPIVSSWILGLLAAVKSAGIRVHVYHPSPDVRDAIQVTRLDTLFDMRPGLDQPLKDDA